MFRLLKEAMNKAIPRNLAKTATQEVYADKIDSARKTLTALNKEPEATEQDSPKKPDETHEAQIDEISEDKLTRWTDEITASITPGSGRGC